MTQNAAFKRAVRARMADTGEPYMVARRKLMLEQGMDPDGGRGAAGAAGDSEELPDLEFDGRRWVERGNGGA